MAEEDTPMTNAPLTPGDDADAEGSVDPEPTSPVIDYSPAIVPYNEAFENDLMNAILYASSTTQTAPRTPSTTTPMINPTTLPVPLSSPDRTHRSPIPGVLLTHGNGYHTGGPGPTPDTVTEFARNFIEEHGIEDAGQLERVVEQLIKEKMEIVKERMREREEAVNRNRAVERELEELKMQRAAELSVAEKIRGGGKK
ncbi:hypothetical protein K458DRAFT_312092 [Lentithecium fluviatile CBS 122367]|uniref:Uncharacterized protein n=1 Tax=Lentithecium fluviatile CBS 122367 TaxID=1168545 RepID=A0A6G1IQN8_9PLEO|nr:hypothetical protein K458DRAFT_312092 [Lentithecium fluviatile CBS 122367]